MLTLSASDFGRGSGYISFMAGKPSIRNYIGAFFDHWSQSVSGGAGLIATAGALGVGEDQNTRLVLLVAAGFAFVVAGYRVWASERKFRNVAENRSLELVAQYAHSLRLEKIDYSQALTPAKGNHKKIAQRHMGFTLHLTNMIGRPVEYRFKKIRLNGIETPIGNDGEVLSANASTIFRTAAIVVAPIAPSKTEQFFLELEYLYGEPGILKRRVRKSITIAVSHSAKKVNYSNQMNEDAPIQ